ncbi:bifunctional riboflavin kinase/FAD synthetase [Panacibacter sp. KCS-6]|uniref:Riboflavin biosynthesis protein n=2 Tax=Limnovirga soli TaxID=2656915 RepID=A0A8J8FHS9_9BACT|nr:bifunctional riboflavin kinase/FAD synthetase [Limnovirga soli]
MQVHQLSDILPQFKNAVITIGTFDGVHTGHQQIIAQLKQEAAAINGETVIITFHPHPRKVIASKPIFMLNTLAEKIELLEAKGIDHLVVVAFNDDFARQSAEAYVKDFLFARFHPHTVIIGYDHRFGRDRQGDYQLLETYGKELGFAVKDIPEHVLNNITVSSTKIRSALFENDIVTANECLGYDYFFEGMVVEGNKLGRTIGYPTANLLIENEEKLIPGNGVYAVTATLATADGFFTHNAMMNIGVRPTVDGTKRMIEVNIFDFDADIYGKTVRVSLKKYLRGEVKFNGLPALQAQLALDKLAALQYLDQAKD